MILAAGESKEILKTITIYTKPFLHKSIPPSFLLSLHPFSLSLRDSSTFLLLLILSDFNSTLVKNVLVQDDSIKNFSLCNALLLTHWFVGRERSNTSYLLNVYYVPGTVLLDLYGFFHSQNNFIMSGLCLFYILGKRHRKIK